MFQRSRAVATPRVLVEGQRLDQPTFHLPELLSTSFGHSCPTSFFGSNLLFVRVLSVSIRAIRG